MLVLNITDRHVVTLSRDGVEIGTVHIAARPDGRIRLALDFPRDVKIWRGETAERIIQKRRQRGELPESIQ